MSELILEATATRIACSEDVFVETVALVMSNTSPLLGPLFGTLLDLGLEAIFTVAPLCQA